MHTSHVLGRTVGLLAFLVGVVMLAVVFWLSWQLFLDPSLTGGTSPNPETNVANRLTGLVVRLAFLLVACIAGSLVASKGIQLYAAGDRSSSTGESGH